MQQDQPPCVSRREFLLAGAGGAAVTVLLPAGLGHGADAPTAVELALYPRKRVARLSELGEGRTLAFNYPLEEQPNFIVKLGVPAQGVVHA